MAAIRSLDPHHRQMLEQESGISPQLIEARGYWTATDPGELAELGFTKAQCIVPALVIPIFSVDGKVVLHQSRPDTPRLNDQGKLVKYETPTGSVMRLDVSPELDLRSMIRDKQFDLYITEGVKKGDSAASRGLCCVTLSGVWNWRGTNERGSSMELADWEAIALEGRKVYIVFDNDVMFKSQVQKAIRRLAGMLKRRGSTVIPLVPQLLGHEGKLGLDDFFVNGGTVLDLKQCADDSLLAELEIVTNNRNLADISQDGLDALVQGNLPPTLFVRSGELVRVTYDERGIPSLQSVSRTGLRGLLARSAKWIKQGKSTDLEVAPPLEVVDDILSMPSWPGIPPIIAITRAPVLAVSGVLSTSPGYCPSSKFYVAAKEQWPNWEGTVQDAVNFLLHDVLQDFPFASDADRSHALALMLLPMVRPVIDGSTPLHLINAPVQGSGKSKLANVCLIPTAGADIAATPGSRDDEEWRKRITSCLYTGASYIFFDDLSGKLESASLNLALTASDFSDRVLQQTKMIRLPVQCVWIATTNNGELSRDLMERTVWIHLDAGVENPAERKFRHPNIRGWVIQNRPKIVAAMCCIVNKWVSDGMPRGKARHSRHDEWSSIIGGILESANVPGFLGNIDELRSSAHSDYSAWATLYSRWWETFRDDDKKAKDVIGLFEQDDDLSRQLGSGNENSRIIKLGYLLKKKFGVVHNGMRLCRGTASAQSGRYRLEVAVARTPTSHNDSLPTPDLDSNLEVGVTGVGGVLGPKCDESNSDACNFQFEPPPDSGKSSDSYMEPDRDTTSVQNTTYVAAISTPAVDGNANGIQEEFF